MTTLVRRIAEHVERDPDRELFLFRDLGAASESKIRYGDLWSGAQRIAGALDAVADRPRTLIVLPLGTDLLFAHLATSLCGGVPAIHSHPSAKVAEETYLEHLVHVLELAAPDVVVTNRRFAAALEKAGSQAPRISIEDLPAAAPREVSGWKAAGGDDLAIIQHSSGSTGLQKGVALTHRMVIEQCRAYARAIAAAPERDRICSWIPLYHDMGLFTTWLMPVLEAIPVAAIDPFAWVQEPAAFLRLIDRQRGTLCWQPNFAYNLLAARVRDEEIEGIDLSSMRGWNNCSEPVRASSHRAFLDRFARHGVRPETLWVCYAMAENAFAVTQAGSTTEPPREKDGCVSVGVPIEGCRIEIIDGEVAIESPYTLKEYFRNPEATAAAIDAEGRLHTGDLGFLHEGHLYITGRKKDLLIVGGRNFYPQDIEAIADECPRAIPGRSVAIGVDDERTGTQRIVVLAETRSRRQRDRRELEAAIRQRVFDQLDCALSEVHAVPHRWLLKTTSGKIARQPNLQRFRDRRAAPRASVAASIALGALLAIAIYVILALQPNLSWGVYAGF